MGALPLSWNKLLYISYKKGLGFLAYIFYFFPDVLFESPASSFSNVARTWHILVRGGWEVQLFKMFSNYKTVLEFREFLVCNQQPLNIYLDKKVIQCKLSWTFLLVIYLESFVLTWFNLPFWNSELLWFSFWPVFSCFTVWGKWILHFECSILHLVLYLILIIDRDYGSLNYYATTWYKITSEYFVSGSDIYLELLQPFYDHEESDKIIFCWTLNICIQTCLLHDPEPERSQSSCILRGEYQSNCFSES